jgi:hypothetical protein
MKRVLLITLSLVLALVGWSAVCAEDGFYVIPSMKGNYAPVPETGQTTSYDIPNYRDDGGLKKGVAWPTPRFTDNNNGTVTDNLTKLIWMKDANYSGLHKVWADALAEAAAMRGDIDRRFGDTGPVDGSKPGDWRLPNLRELQSLADYKFYNPAVPNTLGTGKWAEGNPFLGVQSFDYWSSTTHANLTTAAWFVNFYDGSANANPKSTGNYVWCVRGGP